MVELAFFKHNHLDDDPSIPVRRQAGLLRPFDLVTAQDDGWGWGDQELSNPWFRILRWSAFTRAQAEQFLSPLAPTLDTSGVAMTLPQRRGFYLNMANVALPAAVRSWWQDDTRAVPIFVVPANFSVPLATLRAARAAIVDPDYTGLGNATPISLGT